MLAMLALLRNPRALTPIRLPTMGESVNAVIEQPTFSGESHLQS
jgi:hypothetical protein